MIPARISQWKQFQPYGPVHACSYHGDKCDKWNRHVYPKCEYNVLHFWSSGYLESIVVRFLPQNRELSFGRRIEVIYTGTSVASAKLNE